MKEKRFGVKQILHKKTHTYYSWDFGILFFSARQPRFPVPTTKRKKGRLKIANQCFEHVCKNNSWASDKMQANDFRQEPPCCSSLRTRVPRPTESSKLSKFTEDANVYGNHLWTLAKAISASCLWPRLPLLNGIREHLEESLLDSIQKGSGPTFVNVLWKS